MKKPKSGILHLLNDRSILSIGSPDNVVLYLMTTLINLAVAVNVLLVMIGMVMAPFRMFSDGIQEVSDYSHGTVGYMNWIYHMVDAGINVGTIMVVFAIIVTLICAILMPILKSCAWVHSKVGPTSGLGKLLGKMKFKE